MYAYFINLKLMKTQWISENTPNSTCRDNH